MDNVPKTKKSNNCGAKVELPSLYECHEHGTLPPPLCGNENLQNICFLTSIPIFLDTMKSAAFGCVFPSALQAQER